MTELHVGDTGTELRARIVDTQPDGSVLPLDVSGKAITYTLERPDGSTFERSANYVTDGVDGLTRYVTVAGDINQAGDWRLQARIVGGGSDHHTDYYSFRVGYNLAAA